jgi:xanthine dehydrogenase YagT iron-sulfur-binding subunit
MPASNPDDPRGARGVSRRGFLSSMGVGAVSVALPAPLTAGPLAGADLIEAGDLTAVALNVNERVYRVLVEPRWSLLYTLREELGLTAAKEGCGRGECGACTVLMDGVPRYSCLTLATEAEGSSVTTLEGIMEGEELGPTQQAFAEEDAFQCGYCTPGQIMAAEGLLRASPHPSPEEIRAGMSGNLCRCGAYAHIFRAVERAAAVGAGRGGAS